MLRGAQEDGDEHGDVDAREGRKGDLAAAAAVILAAIGVDGHQQLDGAGDHGHIEELDQPGIVGDGIAPRDHHCRCGGFFVAVNDLVIIFDFGDGDGSGGGGGILTRVVLHEEGSAGQVQEATFGVKAQHAVWTNGKGARLGHDANQADGRGQAGLDPVLREIFGQHWDDGNGQRLLLARW